MNKEKLTDKLAHMENVFSLLRDDTIKDPVISVARESLWGGSGEAELEAETLPPETLRANLSRMIEKNESDSESLDLESKSHDRFVTGIHYLALGDADNALEEFQICVEMAEANGDTHTQAWGLALHGFTKVNNFEMLHEEGKKEIEKAQSLMQDNKNMVGATAIAERMGGKTF